MKHLLALTTLSMLVAPAAHAAGPSFTSDGTISICTTAAFPPLTYKANVGDTLPIGIDIDIVEALADEWGVETEYTTTEFSGLLPALGSGRCHLIVSGIYINDERRETYDGVRYMRSATVIVTNAENKDVTGPDSLSGKTLALEAGTYYGEERIDPLNRSFVEAGKPEVAVHYYPTQQAAYQQVLVGRVDATLTEEAEGAYRVATTEGQFSLAYTWDSDFTYGIYMRRESEDVNLVRASLKELSARGFFARLAEKYGLDPSVFDVDYDS